MVQRLSVELLIIAGIGLVLGLLGPFGTYPMPLALRLAYWIGFILIGYAIFRPITRTASWLHDMSKIPFPFAIGMAVLVASLPLAFLIGFAANGMQMNGPMLTSAFPALYVQCAGIGFAIFMVMRTIFPEEKEQAENAQPRMEMPAISSQKTKLHDRLPAGFPDHILALSVEDHYVRVHAADQSHMLLMRLRDAMSEVENIYGTQVHRSWWVAHDAVNTAKRRDRNWRLLLENGIEAPVSRSHVAKLKQMGWMD